MDILGYNRGRSETDHILFFMKRWMTLTKKIEKVLNPRTQVAVGVLLRAKKKK